MMTLEEQRKAELECLKRTQVVMGMIGKVVDKEPFTARDQIEIKRLWKIIDDIHDKHSAWAEKNGIDYGKGK